MESCALSRRHGLPSPRGHFGRLPLAHDADDSERFLRGSAPPGAAEVHDWMLLPMSRSAAKRATFLSDAETARLLLPEDDILLRAGGARLLEDQAQDLARDLAKWADNLLAAVLEGKRGTS